LIIATSGVFHIAHASVCAFSAYAFCFFLNSISNNVFLAAFFALLVSSVLGIIIEATVYSTLRKKRSHDSVLLLASIATLVILTNILSFSFGEKPKSLFFGEIPKFYFRDAFISYAQITQILVFIIIGLLFYLFIKRTRFGILASAISQNPALASILGIRIERIRLLSIAIGSAMGGAGFILLVSETGVDPNRGMNSTVIAAVSCIIVGANRFIAPLGSALLLGILTSVLVFFIPAIWISTLIYALLVILLVIKPEGILIKKGRFEEK